MLKLCDEIFDTLLSMLIEIYLSRYVLGDKIFVTSTDYDWEQVEEFTVVPCSNPRCSINTVRLDRKFPNIKNERIQKLRVVPYLEKIRVTSKSSMYVHLIDEFAPNEMETFYHTLYQFIGYNLF